VMDTVSMCQCWRIQVCMSTGRAWPAGSDTVS
jgi:hypothetical protein